MSITNYIVVVKALEDNNFLISFPDFEDLRLSTDSEDKLQSIATEAIKNKLIELKENNLVVPEAKKMKDVSSGLNEGEFTIFIPIDENTVFKDTKTSFKSVELDKNESKATTNITTEEKVELKTAATTFKNEKVDKKITKLTDEANKSNLGSIAGIFGIVGGVIAVINTLFLSLVKVEIPFFGSYSITFFRGLDFFANFSKDIRTLQVILFFFGVFFITLAGLLIYSSLIKNRSILLYSLITNFIFLLIFYVILSIMLSSGEAKEFISISFIKILLYFVSLVLAFLSYFMMHSNNANKIEETEKTLKTILENGDDKNEKRL